MFYRLLVGGFLGLFLGGSVVVASYELLPTQNVKCWLLNDKLKPCPQELTRLIQEHLKGKPLLKQAWDQDSTNAPFKNQPYTLIVDRKKLPGQLELIVNEEVTQYALVTDDNQIWLIGQHGTIKQRLESQQDLPLLPTVKITFFTEEFVAHNSLRTPVHTPLSQLITALEDQNLDFQNLTWTNAHTLTLDLASGQQVVLDPFQAETSALKLKLIVAELTTRPELEGVIEIDLRFKFPVLRTR